VVCWSPHGCSQQPISDLPDGRGSHGDAPGRGTHIQGSITYRENTWRQALSVGKYTPQWGHRYVGFQANGKPVALLVGFVDDFKIHGFHDTPRPNLPEGKNASTSTDPKVLQVPLRHHRTPTLRIPPQKVSRCLASVDFLLSCPW
jgi:hypothetical protein